ncbi:MAG TPA: FAD-dependent monooxygenase [Acidobacteriaceae bacterium]|nr:FAD-dependent monooxygenase [Acidobacteriaceae bacterium]
MASSAQSNPEQSMDTDVIIVGAGPVGLFLAHELGLTGVRAVVLEKLSARSGQSKATGVQPRTAEVLDLRGLLAELREQALPREAVGGHFAGLPVPLDCHAWNTRYPYPLSIPQGRIEAFLAERLARYAIPLWWGQAIVGLEQDESGVTALVSGPGGETHLRARYLVGCDGGHSTVRKLVGVNFPGRDGKSSMVVADVRLAGGAGKVPTRARHFSEHIRRNGDVLGILSPLGDGVSRLLFGGPAQQTLARDAPITETEVRAALRASYGADVELQEILWASRFSDASRQVEHYQVGRVFLAGDAAHIHIPTGGQGLNLGLQDAFNLGWKLAAQVKGQAPAGLLESYHTERHPVGARVLQNTRAQGLLMMLQSDEDGSALRELFIDLMRLPETNHYLAGMISGLDVRYALPGADASPLIGRRMLDLDLSTPDGQTRVSQLLQGGRGLLLDLGRHADLAAVAASSSVPVDYIQASTSADFAADAVLVRPDGYICWSAENASPDIESALHTWFGSR